MPTTIVLVRHGETDWNRESRFQGHSDTCLNDAGRAQVADLAHALEETDFSAVYSSPLERAAETARIIASKLGLEVRLDDALMEVDVGSWAGLTRSEIETRYADGFARWSEYGHGWDDGETYEELGLRVVAGLQRIAQSHPDQHVLVVTHGGPIRSALAAADRVSFGEARRSIAVLENCATVQIVVRDRVLERVD